MNTDPHKAYMHAKKVIKGRWPEKEPIILTDPDTITVTIISGTIFIDHLYQTLSLTVPSSMIRRRHYH